MGDCPSLSRLLSLPVYIFAGSEDFDDKYDAQGGYHPDWWTDRMWQGNGQMEKAGNLHRELLIADRRLKGAPIPRGQLGGFAPAPGEFTPLGAPGGVQPAPGEALAKRCYRAPDAPFNVYLQPLLGADHENGRIQMKDWLIANWWKIRPRPNYNPFTCVYPTEAP
jgi:hypothetical protein